GCLAGPPATLGGELLDPLVAEAPPGLVHQRSHAGRLERAESIAKLKHPPPSLEEEPRVLGQRGGAEARQPVLPGPEDLPLAPDGEIDLRQGEAVALGRDRVQAGLRRSGLGVGAETADSPMPPPPR